MITYKKMSLFDAPKGALLMHACNAQGVWGSGIAKEFKVRYPAAFEWYRMCCDIEDMVGQACISGYVGCLVTSENYGNKKDSPDKIIIQTILALQSLIDQTSEKTIYCNKFNSGLFAVPWERTEAVLEYFSERYGIEFVVCDPDLISP